MWKLSFALDSTRKLEFKSEGHLREAVARRIQLNLNIIIPILFRTCATQDHCKRSSGIINLYHHICPCHQCTSDASDWRYLMIVAPHVIAACFLILNLILNMLLLLFLFYASESYSHMILAGHFLLQSEPRLQYIDIY